MENSNNTTKIVGGILIGLAAGAILGMLFAPDKGSETRKKISSMGDDVLEKIKEESKHLLALARKDLDVIRDEASKTS